MPETFNEIEDDPKNAGEESDIETEIGASRDNIGPIVEGFPVSENGFCTVEGKRYGTVNACSDYLKILPYRIVKKIKAKQIEPIIGQTPSGESEKYYPVQIFIDFFPKEAEEAEGGPIANEEGYFFRDGEINGTMDYWVRHYNLDKTTFEAQAVKSKIQSTEGKTHDRQMELFYAEHDIRKVIPRWYAFQKKLLYELHKDNKLPRLKIKKRSILHRALEGDIMLLIPKEYTGIYQWLQKELNLNPLGPKQVFVFIEKRGCFSVVFKSELEEIR